MKKALLIALASFAGIVPAMAQVAIGPEVGLNMSKYSGKSDGNTVSASFVAGARIGGVLDLPLGNNIYLQSSIFYVMNGSKETFGSNGQSYDATYHVNSIEIPIRVIYKLGKPGDNRFFFGVYPYIAMNISGKVDAPGGSMTLKIGSDANNDEIKSMDFGAGVNVGYQLAAGLFVRAFYQAGFVNLQPGGNSDNSQKASALGLNVGWLFGGKGKGAAK